MIQRLCCIKVCNKILRRMNVVLIKYRVCMVVEFTTTHAINANHH